MTAPYQSIVSAGIALPAYTPPSFDAYVLVFTPANGFLASTQGAYTTYPHRALMYRAAQMFSDVNKLFLSQSAAAMDFVWIRLSTDADYVPNTMAGTPNGFRLTRVATDDVLGLVQPNSQVYYSGSNPSTDSYAPTHDLSSAVRDAIQKVAAAPLTTVPVYYTKQDGTYAVLYNVSYVSIALSP